MALDYVKFQRGTPADYSRLTALNRVEDNTLYFIYENNASTGSLYLGKILIGTVGSGESSISNLSDLNDVLIEAVGATDILVYSTDGKWKNASLSEIANLIADQQGLGFEIDTNAFQFQAVDGVKHLKLLGLDTAPVNSMPFKSVNGTIGWTENNVDTIAGKVSDLEAVVNNIPQEIAKQVSEANHLTYKTVGSLDDATEQNTVYLLPTTSPSGNNSYDEYMIVNGALERLGNWGVDLSGYATVENLQAVSNSVLELKTNLESNYVTNTKFNSVVGDITSLTNYNAENPTTVIKELNNLYSLFNSISVPSVDKVGDLTKLVTYEEGKETTVVDELNNIYQHLVWQPIVVE